MIRSLILNVTFDCADAEAMARFWSEVTRWPRSKEEMPGNPFWLVGPDGDASPRNPWALASRMIAAESTPAAGW